MLGNDDFKRAGIGEADFDLDGEAVRAGLRHAVDLLNGGRRKIVGYDVAVKLQVAVAGHELQVGVALEIILQIFREALRQKGRPRGRVVLNGGNGNGSHRRVNVGAVERVHAAAA